MAFFNFSRWLRFRPKVKTYRKNPRFVPWFEALEDRTLMSTLPAAVVANPTTIASGFSPTIVQDPANPQNLVEFQAITGTAAINSLAGTLGGSYSTNGGHTWTPFLNTDLKKNAFPNSADPLLTFANSVPQPFAMVTNPTAAWDRGENIYVAEIQRSTDDTSGAVVFQKFSFSTGVPVNTVANTVLERWYNPIATNADPILNPVVAVDNNLTSYTDSATGAAQTDSMATMVGGHAKAVYVAWNTSQAAPTTFAIPNFNANVIKVVGSSDGGASFTSPEFVNNDGNANILGSHYADPQIVFTQGSADGRVKGGQLVFVWNDFGNTQVVVDSSQPDGAVAGTAVAASATFTAGSITGVASVVSIAAAGSGYTVGDILTVVGGTGVAAKLQVTSVDASGDVTGFVVYQGGIYSVDPLSPVTLTGGTGAGAQASVSFTQVSFTSAASVAAVAGAGGVGYAIGDLLTVSGGTVTTVPNQATVTVSSISVPATSAVLVNGGGAYKAGDVLTVSGGGPTAATITVGTVDASGVILTFALTTGGSYTAKPANPVSVTGGAGSGAKFSLTYSSTGTITGVTLTAAGSYTALPPNPNTVTVAATTAAVAGGGTGYKVNDILNVLGGTVSAFGTAAQLKVTAISKPVTAALVAAGGNGYAAGDLLTVLTGTGTAAELQVTTISASSQVVTGEAIFAGGSGYLAGDILTVLLGTGTAAQIKVLTVNGTGAVISAAIVNAGNYTTAPTNPVDVASDPGNPGSSGAQFTLTFSGRGAVTGVLIYNPGSYTALPTNPVNVSDTETPAAAGAKFTLTFSATGAVAGVSFLLPGAYNVEPVNAASVSDITTPTANSATFTLAYSATGMAVSALALASTGVGYTAGDLLTVVGGTFTTAAELTVNTVDAKGGITSVTVFNPGSYTSGATPANAVSVTGGTGSDATFNLLYIAATVQVATDTPFPPSGSGTGYAIGDILKVNGGNFTTQATLTVSGINAATGAITAATISNAGNYINDGTQPTANVTFTDMTGTGVNARFTLTYSAITVEVTGTPAFAGTGSGYIVGDIVTVNGGAGTFTKAQLKVTTVDLFGAITAATIPYAGSYTGGGQPANPVSVTSDPNNASASGAAFTLTYSPTATGALIKLTFNSASGTGPIPDATPTAGGGPDTPGIVSYSIPVSIASPSFIVGDLEVNLDITHPHLDQLRLDLLSPTGIDIPLLENSIDGSGNAIGGQGVPDQANLGVVNVNSTFGFSSLIGTVFDQNAPRPINDGSANAPYASHFQPEASSLAVFNGAAGGSANLSGNWTLKITDVKADSSAPYQLLNAWSLHFTAKEGGFTTGFGGDTSLKMTGAGSLIAGAASASTPYALANTGPYGPAGVGPDVSVAIDNSLGSFSPYEGRIYLAYTGGGGTDTNVYLSSFDDLTPKTTVFTPNASVKVNDDSVADGFSQGNRPQFMPTVAVDDVTGTVGVMYYDGRWDASVYNSQSRAANSFSDSIDGGATFSPSTTLNTEQTAFNEITGATVDIGPIPGNQSQADLGTADTFGFGDRQGMVINAGHVISVFASNQNSAGTSIMTASVTIAAGPRIIAGDMGAITAASTFLGVGYNESFAVDGTQEFNGFEIVFDRPIDKSTFTPSQVEIMYRDTVTSPSLPGVIIPSGDYTVTALDAGGPWGFVTGANAAKLATTFLVELTTPRSAVGTYSYAIGNLVGAPVIRDHLETATVVGTVGTTKAAGNFMDENQDAVTGEKPGSINYATSVISPGAFGTGIKYSLNDILTVTGGTFSSAATIRVTAVLGGVITGAVLLGGGLYSSDPANAVSVTGGTGTGASFDLTYSAGQSSGDVFAIPTPVAPPGAILSNLPFQLPYDPNTLPLIVTGPQMVGSSVDFNPKSGGTSDNLVLNSTNNGLDVSFDRNIQAGTFTAANIERITGPIGQITPYTLGPTVTFNSINGVGSGATGVATIVGGFVTAVNILTPGSGYTAPPTVVFNGGGGQFAAGTASISGGLVTGVTVTSGGLGYTSMTLPAGLVIPAGGTLNAPMTISDSLQVNDLSVGLNITQAQLSELSITLIAPDGTKVLLLPGGTGANLTNAVFDDNAPASIAAGVGPYTGVFRPVQHAVAADTTGGGSGYKLGDALTVMGGVFSTPTQLTVASVGALLGATAIVGGGTLYQVGDVLTVQGGTFSTAAQIVVNTVGAGGVITSASVVIEGSYTALPASPVTVTGGHGSGATFKPAFTAVTGVTITNPGAYNATPPNPISVTDATTPFATGASFALSYAGLSALNGKDYQGTWMLQITDNGTHGGTLNAWALNPISVTPNPQVLTSTAIVSGGTGYKVGDYVTLQGGTVTAAAQLQVTSIGPGGVITQVALIQPGLYAVPPSGTVAVAGGSGTGATFTVVFSSDGLANRTFRISLPTQTVSGTYSIQVGPDTEGNYLKDTSLNTATVVAGGSGYSVGTILTVTGGTGASAQFMVSKVNAGAITAVELVDPGAYTVYPQAVAGPLPAAAIPTGGSGYKVNDNLTVLGGVFTTAATLQVTSIGAGGVVTGAKVVSGGSYTTNPTNPVRVTDVTTPAATGATFDLPVAVTSGSGSGATLALVIGNEIDTNLNAGIDVLRSVNPVAVNNGTLLPNLYQSGTINTPIPAGQTIDSVINVPDSFQVEGVTLQLSIQHQNDPDLTATLFAPDGVPVLLFSGVGASGSSPHANFTNTTFADTATIPIQDAATVPITGIGVGPFNPQLPLSTFTGGNSQGQWILQITSVSSTLNGSLVDWNLTLKSSVPGSGLGEPIADQFNASFRLFTQDPTNPVSNQSWTAVGPASINGGSESGRVGGLALDPSDPSGNTVYVAGASGSVWKTTDFLTTASIGPTYVPLTELGPGNSLNTGGITVFPRNSDPNQSIIFVVTGEGDIGSPGVGFLRSMDGGKTWRLLDSTINVVTAANKKPGETIGSILPIGDARRDHKFDGVTSFKVIVDPVAEPDGNVIVYAAMGNGIWRSNDTGATWTLMQAGFATDVVLSAGSASSFDSNGNSTGNLQILYGAIEGQGVYYTTSAPTTASMTIRNGGQGVPTRRDIDPPPPDKAIPVNNDGLNPGGAAGERIELAAPAFVPGQPLQNTLYEGWLYAQVSTGALYETKDFGLNWTLIHLPVSATPKIPPVNTGTNNNLLPDYVVMGSAKFPQNNYNMSLAVDPTNPNIVYIGGTADANPNLDGGYGGFIRVDATGVQDVYDEVAYANSNNDGGLIQTATSAAGEGGVTVKGPGYGITTSQPGSAYLDMLRDPQNPFTTPASLQFTGIAAFNNTGLGATYLPFDGGIPDLGGSTDQHRLITFVDPLTGQTRLIFGDDQGVWTGTDNGSGVAVGNLGGSVSFVGSRNGNLQITQLYDGASQPSTIAADIAGALFYGVAQDDGFPQSSSSVLDTGAIGWSGPGGDGSGVKVDQTGTGLGGGTVYTYAWPCCGASPLPSDFFTVDTPGVVNASRTTGLLQPGDDPYNDAGNWGFTGGSLFAVNPIDPSAIVMSSRLGNVFLTSGPSLGYGVQWFPIAAAATNDIGGAYAPALAFGAPVNAAAPLDNFIYAGTTAGRIYVTFTGGGAGTPWTNLSAGLLDNSPVQFIVTNPLRGSHEAYAVTGDNVYWMADSSIPGASWVNITGNLFSANLTRTMFNDPTQLLATLKSLTALQADWRYAIPDNLANPGGPKHPVLYVGAVGGVYRSLDKGKTWTYFPDETIDGALQEGGLFPSMGSGALYGQGVTNLALSLGNINPLNGTPSQPYGRDMLVATTYGMGVYAIRLDDQITVPGGNALYTYAISAVPGPHVSSTTLLTGAGVFGMQVTFSGPVDPATFTAAKVNFITDPQGNLIPVSSIFDTGAANHNIYDIFFTSTYTAYGFYTLSLGPNISDYSGNKMDQNQNDINGENPADVYNARFLYQPFTNNAPVLTATSASIASEFEDQTAANATTTSVNSIVLGLGWPISGLTDQDNTTYQANSPSTFAPVGIAVTSVDDTNGLWEYSLDNGVTWNTFAAAGAVESFPTAARLLEANSNGIASIDLIEFVPNASFTGTSTFTFQGWDLTSGLSVYGQPGGTADATVNGGSTAFSTGSGVTVTTNVLFVNDQPSFTASNPPTVLEGAPAQTVNGWVTNFNPGGAPPSGDLNEHGQTPTYTVSGVSVPSMFSVLPAVSPAGVLTYTLANAVSGTSTFNVQAQDSGGTQVLAAAVAASGGSGYILGDKLDVQGGTTVSGGAGPPAVLQVTAVGAFLGALAAGNIPAGGSGYHVNDILSVLGGVFTSAATIQVTSIGAGGAITGAKVISEGSYTVLPTNPVIAADLTTPAASGAKFTLNFSVVTVVAVLADGSYTVQPPNAVAVTDASGPGAGATFNLFFATQVLAASVAAGNGGSGYALNDLLQIQGGVAVGATAEVQVSAVGVVSAAGGALVAANINVGSAGYVAGDTLTVAGGTFTTPAVITVLTVDPVSGTILTASVTPGSYTVAPTNPVSITGGTGSGATFNLNFTAIAAVTVVQAGTYGIQPPSPATVTDLTNPDVTGATLTLAFGRIDLSFVQTFTITVLFVNDQPSFIGSNQGANEDSGKNTVANWATFNPGGAPDANELGQVVLGYTVSGVTSIPATGSPANAFAPGGTPKVSIAGTLTYTLAANYVGKATFNVTVQDDGGEQVTTAVVTAGNAGTGYTAGDLLTVLGGAFTTPAQLQVTSVDAFGAVTGVVVTQQDGAYQTLPTNDVSVTDVTNGTASGATFTLGGVVGNDTSAPESFTIFVNLVNDQPSFNASNPPPVVEDNTTPQTVTGWATGFIPGGAGEEAGQSVLAYHVTAVGTPTMFATQPAVDVNGNLTYTLNADVSGTSTFTTTVQDNGGTQAYSAVVAATGSGYIVGDLLNVLGGTFTTQAQIQVTAVGAISGAAPIGAAGTGYKVGDVLTAVGGLFSTATTIKVNTINGSGGITGATVLSAGSYALIPATPVSVTGGNGTGANFNLNFSAVAGFTILTDGAYTTQPANPVNVADVPHPGASGATFTLTFKGIDTSLAKTFTISVLFVNDQPAFTATSPPPALEDSGANTVKSWVTGFNPGGAPDANEASQKVHAFLISGISNPSLFAVAPAIDPTTFNLTYTLNPDVSGASNFNVQVQDSAGTQVIGAALVTGGTGYKVGDMLTIQGGTAFNAAQLQVTSIGAGGAIGNVIVTQFDGAYTVRPTNPVSVTDVTTSGASGATFNLSFSGVDTSAPQTFTISALFVNDAPSVTASNQGANENTTASPVTHTVANWATFNPGGAPDANEIGQTLVGYTISGVTNPGLYAAGGQPAVSPSGTLTYTLAPNVAGPSNFTITAQDSGGMQALGVASIVTGGTGYVVGDILTVQGGTFTTPAQLQVTSVGALGVLTGAVVVLQDGNYTVPPANPVSVFDITHGSGLNATLNLTYGGVNISAPETFTINVNVINDQPSFTASNPPPVVEDTITKQTVANWATFNAGGTGEESGQAVLAYHVTAISNPGLFATAPAVDTSGNLTYTLNADQSGTSTFNVAVQDNGGMQAITAAKVAAGTGYQVGDLLNVQGGTFTTAAQIQVTSVGAVAGAAPIAAGGTSYKVGDVLTVAGGLSSAPATITVNTINGTGGITGATVTTAGSYAVIPTGPVSVTGGAGTNATFNLNFSAIVGYTLYIDGAYTVQPANPVSVKDATTPAAAGATFTLTFAGVDTSTSQPFTISSLFVNDQPSFTAKSPPAALEDSGANTVNAWATAFNPGGAPDVNEAGQSVHAYLVTGVTNPALFSAGPAVDTSGNLTYTLNPDLAGTSNFTVQVQDNAGMQAISAAIVGTGSGYNVGDLLTVKLGTFYTPAQLQVTSVGAGGAITGVIVTQQDGGYTVLPANPVSVTDVTTPAATGATFTLGFAGVDTSAAQTFTISSLFVNDVPSFTGTNQGANENSGAHTVNAWATNFNPGGAPDANEAGQKVNAYIVSAVTNASLFAVLPAVDPTTGNLTYTLNANVAGTSNFNVQVQDNGGVQAITAAIAATGSGYKVGDLLNVVGGTSFTAAQLQVTSIGAGGAITGVAITQQDGAYTVKPANPVSVTDVTTPAASGATFTLTYGGVDTSAAKTFTLNVNLINDAPSFTASNPPPVVEDTAAKQTISGWATNFNPGGTGEESGQAVLAYHVSAISNPGLFAVAPAVDTSGNLTYTLNADQSGTSTFAVAVQDNGGLQVISAALATAGTGYTVGELLTVVGGTGTAAQIEVTSIGAGGAITGFTLFGDGTYTAPPPTTGATVTGSTGANATFNLTTGGVDTSAAQTFTVSALFVNDQPTFTATDPPAANINTGAHTVTGWAVFNPGGAPPLGDANEQSQSPLAYTVSAISNPALFTAAGKPAVDTSGNLTYTLAAGQSGTSTFTVGVEDNGGMQAIAAALGAAGSGYKVGDFLNVQGGAFSTPAQLQVTSIGAGGAITGVIITQQDGVYTATPANPVSVTDVTTPAASGATFNLTFAGVNTSATQTFTITVNTPAFTFNPATLPNATAAAAYSQTITASGGTAPYAYTISGGALPAGLTLAANGTLSGTPTVAGNSSFNVQATDAKNITGVQGYTLTVNAPVITITPASLPAGKAGVSYSQVLTAGGGDAPYSNFTISAGALPAGLTISSSGTISGTPTAVGAFSFTVTVQDSTTGPAAPYKGSQSVSLTIAAPSITISPSNLSGGQAGVAYNQTLNGSGGTAPYTFAVSSGTLPAGLALSTSGALTGTPTAVGSFTFTVKATDSTTGSGTPFTGSQSYTVAVAAPTISFTPATLFNTIAGVVYSQTLTGQGGTAPYSNFTTTAGALPSGLTLSSSGTIGGTTASVGTFTFTVRAQDSTTGAGTPYTGSQNYSLTVSAPFNPATLSGAVAGAAYSQAITAVAGSGPASNFSVSGALPGGVTLSSGGVLSGTPTAVGTFTFTVSASDTSPSSGPFTAMQQYTLTVSAPDISFTPTTLTTAISGVAYSQTLSGSGGTSPYSNFKLTGGALPSGLTLSSGGAITGTTTALGNFNFTVQAQDSTTGPSAPYTGSQNYTLAVSAPFNPTSLPAATAGVNYSQAINAIAGTGPASNFSITGGALPGGVTLSTGGVLNGAPTALGSFTFTVSASDSSSASGSFTASQQYTLTVNPPTITVTPATLSAATAGVAYNQALSATGGTAPYSQFALKSGTLPGGLTLSPSGALSGTPTAVGTFSFTVQAQDSTTGPAAPYTGSTSYSLVVGAPVITLSPASLTAATAGAVYSQPLSGVGGTAPYSNFKVTSGALPAGLTLSSAGVLGGTATAVGSFNFTVTAQDSTNGPAAPYTGSQVYSLLVNPPVIVLSPSSLTAAMVGAAYNQTLIPSGGTAPYSNFKIITGSLPSGLALNAATGVLNGTPTASGPFSFTVQVQDSTTGAGSPYTGSQNYSLTVTGGTIVLSALPAAQVGAAYNQTVVASGGTAPYTFALTSGALPAGLTFNASTGVVSGKPTAGGTFHFTITATDSSTGSGSHQGSQAYTFVVAAPTLVFSPATLPGAAVGASYSQALTVSGGTAPYSGFVISSGALPAGLTLSSTGTITGTPTAGGTFGFTVQATDASTGSGPYTGSQNYSLTVVPPTLVVTPATLPAGLVAVPYSVQIAVTGGTAPYKSFVVTTGTLPVGLTLSTTGLLSGMPTGGGIFNFTVGVTDSSTGSGPYSTGKAYSISVTPPNFSYDAATKTLTISGSNFQYSQSTTANASGTHTNYNFTMDGFSETLPDTTVSSVVVNGVGSSASAILITSDTYTAANGSTQETPERISLGSLNNDGTGTLSRFTNNDAGEASFTFLTLHNFPISYAYVGRNDSTVNLYGTVGEPYNGFVTAGNYSYMGGPGMFHLVQGAPSVYGYSAGQPADFAYHYAANPGSAFVVSGTAYSYMSTMDTVNGVTNPYFNVGVGFLQNTGVSKNGGADTAYFFDSPGNDTFVGGTTISYMYINGPPSPYAEFDAAYGFAMVNAESFVGGIDFAYIYDTTHNNTSGFTVIYPGQIGRIVD